MTTAEAGMARDRSASAGNGWKAGALRSAARLARIRLAAFAMFAACAAHAQHETRIIVPYAAGGEADTVARLLTRGLAKEAYVVENRAGKAGLAGAHLVAKAKPDGRTLLLMSRPALRMSLNRADSPHAYQDISLEPVVDVGWVPWVLVVHPDLPEKSVSDLVQTAKRQPDRTTFATLGPDSQSAELVELLGKASGIKVTSFRHKDSNATLEAVLTRRVHAAFLPITAALPHIRSGKLRALAVTGGMRSPMLPEVVTMGEAGYPSCSEATDYFIYVPKGTAEDTRRSLRVSMTQARADGEVDRSLRELGMQPPRPNVMPGHCNNCTKPCAECGSNNECCPTSRRKSP